MVDLISECMQLLHAVKHKLQKARIPELEKPIDNTIEKFEQYKRSRKFQSSISPDDIDSPGHD